MLIWSKHFRYSEFQWINLWMIIWNAINIDFLKLYIYLVAIKRGNKIRRWQAHTKPIYVFNDFLDVTSSQKL